MMHTVQLAVYKICVRPLFCKLRHVTEHNSKSRLWICCVIFAHRLGSLYVYPVY